MLGWESNKVLKKRSITTVYQNTEKEKRNSPRPGIEPGPSTWQAEILTTRLSRNCCKRLKCFTTCYQLTAFSTVQSLVCVYSLKLHGQEKKGYVSILDKEKNYSLEPDLNQRPMDNCHINNYSPPLYQLSYRGWQRVQANNCYSKQVLCDLNKSVTRISFYPVLISQGV